MSDNKVRYIDRPELMETFVDSLGMTHFDGVSFRIDLCVKRLDEPKPPSPPTQRKYPVCRLVLTPPAMLDMFNQLQKFMGALHQQGIIKKEEMPPPSTPRQ